MKSIQSSNPSNLQIPSQIPKTTINPVQASYLHIGGNTPNAKWVLSDKNSLLINS
ncbi:hypothetical protein NC652_012345 [Populus alba x Populus x berolinensis]|nr:hypothetical protein NC652_012345 [Populus alba x Populus x berolinensis]